MRGELVDGQSLPLVTAPTDVAVGSPGVHELELSLYDYTYGTRDPLIHRVHVGVDGFTLFPVGNLDGPDGLGVPHGTQQIYTPMNRWIVPQDLTVSATEDWVEIEGNPGSQGVSLTLPCRDCEALTLVDVVVNGSGLEPGVHTASLTFRSDDSGSPPYEITSEVRLDHCRRGFRRSDAAE